MNLSLLRMLESNSTPPQKQFEAQDNPLTDNSEDLEFIKEHTIEPRENYPYHPEKGEMVICSAIWYKDESKLPLQDLEGLRLRGFQPYNVDQGVVVTGWRHPNIIQLFHSLTGLRTVTNGEDSCGEYVQGFLSSHNRFLTRAQAGVMAYMRGQTKTLIKSLTSEDIY